MTKINNQLKFFLTLAKIQTVMIRKFDSKLNGLSLSEFIILLQLSQNEGEKARRVDLAEQVGLTASGITRLLLPMEKIGLVSKEVNENDARSSFVILAPGGRQKLIEGIDRAELFCEDIIPKSKLKKVEEATEVLIELSEIIK